MTRHLRPMLAAGWAGTALLLAACGGGNEPAASPQAESVAASAMPMSADSELTQRRLDVAIDGDGLLVAHAPGTGERLYTRWGRLDLDRDGHLVHAQGWRIGGVAPDDAQALAGQDVATREKPLPAVPWTLAFQPASQTRIEVNVRLPSTPDPFSSEFDPVDPSTYDDATSMTVYFHTPSVTGCTLLHVRVDGDAVVEQDFGAWHRLCFHPDGTLKASSSKAPPLVLRHPDQPLEGRPAPAVQGLQVVFAATRNAGSFAVTFIGSDGYAEGHLAAIAIQETGLITALYDNGVAVPHALLVLAKPALADRYQRAEAVGWRCAGTCSTPVMVPPGQQLTGLLQQGRLATVF